MARNGATKPAAVPEELYDTLRPDEQDMFDGIAAKGFRPERDESLRWLALSTKGDDRIGPCPTLSDLAIDVDRFLEASGELDEDTRVTKIKADSRGNQYLDGMEPVVDQDLADAICAEYADKQAWNEAGKKKKESKIALAAVAKAKKNLFKEDPDNSDSLIYRVGDIVCRMKKDFTVTVKTELLEASEDDD